MSQSPPPSDARPTWSRQIQAKYRCELPPDLTSWFDQAVWRQIAECPQANEFSHPIAPEQLLDDAPDAIWPALMPCDLLPVIGNDQGDWLCLRIGASNTIDEVVHWYHGGGDWIPWGSSFSEAILFDHLRRRLPGFSRDHAIAAGAPLSGGDAIAEGESVASDCDSNSGDACKAEHLVRWAASHVDNSMRFLENSWQGRRLAEELLTIEGCTAAVCCQLVIDALENRLLDEQAVSEFASDTNEVQRWLFDNRLIPSKVQTSLSNRLGIDQEQLFNQQRWNEVDQLCEVVTKVFPHLGWAWELGGYADERSGQVEKAISRYRKGLPCSIFSDQTVRLRTHGFDGDGQKFSVARLAGLGFCSEDAHEQEYLQLYSVQPTDDRREQIRLHFSRLAGIAAEQGEYHAALDCWMRAGWDLGAEPMIAFADLLDQIARAADLSGSDALASLAKVHRACFKDRYRI